MRVKKINKKRKGLEQNKKTMINRKTAQNSLSCEGYSKD